MVKHIIIWDLNDGMSDDEKSSAALRIKTQLENLKNLIPEIASITVHTQMLDSSNGDIMLDSEFADEAALAVYAVHTEHIKVKDYISTVVKSRKCVDFKF